MLWLGIPAGWLWLAARLSDEYAMIYAAALVGAPVTMVVWTILLTRLNTLYLRVIGALPSDGGRADTRLNPLTGERRAPRASVVMETSMTVSVILAVLAMAVWFFFFAGSSLPNAP